MRHAPHRNGDDLCQRHSFIQMSKLSNVRGRISYITSHAKQENLYATYRTADHIFGATSQGKPAGVSEKRAQGKCIEARELIIALPGSLHAIRAAAVG